ncbi:MAG: hypothetical protein JSW11_03085 [Candidatus Heimdallarchaeota archaeon]|nr:MAG: hypothetical protein JSW11_03085 [Candidatus Heimdallarchaeota archaeon]
MDKRNHLEFNRRFLEFVEYLIQLGYGEERTGFIEGVVQRVFFDDWVKFLAFQKEIDGPFTKIKTELLDDD